MGEENLAIQEQYNSVSGLLYEVDDFIVKNFNLFNAGAKYGEVARLTGEFYKLENEIAESKYADTQDINLKKIMHDLKNFLYEARSQLDLIREKGNNDAFYSAFKTLNNELCEKLEKFHSNTLNNLSQCIESNNLEIDKDLNQAQFTVMHKGIKDYISASDKKAAIDSFERMSSAITAKEAEFGKKVQQELKDARAKSNQPQTQQDADILQKAQAKSNYIKGANEKAGLYLNTMRFAMMTKELFQYKTNMQQGDQAITQTMQSIIEVGQRQNNAMLDQTKDAKQIHKKQCNEKPPEKEKIPKLLKQKLYSLVKEIVKDIKLSLKPKTSKCDLELDRKNLNRKKNAVQR